MVQFLLFYGLWNICSDRHRLDCSFFPFKYTDFPHYTGTPDTNAKGVEIWLKNLVFLSIFKPCINLILVMRCFGRKKKKKHLLRNYIGIYTMVWFLIVYQGICLINEHLFCIMYFRYFLINYFSLYGFIVIVKGQFCYCIFLV